MTDPKKTNPEKTEKKKSELESAAAGASSPLTPDSEPTKQPSTPTADPGAAPPPRDTEQAPPTEDPAAKETAEEAAPPPAPGEDATLGNRVLAVLIDGLIATGIFWIPAIGPILAIAYALARDALPFLEGQSIGKKVMNLRAISTETGKPLTNDWAASAVRNILLVIPLGALVELFVLINDDQNQRLGDQWAKTKVVVQPTG